MVGIRGLWGGGEWGIEKIVCECRDCTAKYQKIDSILNKITPVSLSIRGIIYTQN